MLFLLRSVGTWRIIIQSWSKVTQSKGNQGIYTQGKVTQSNDIHIITQAKINISRVTWVKSLITQGQDKVTQGKFNLGRS